MTTPTTRRIEVFRAGTFTAMDGRSYAFSADDVGAIASGYDAVSAPAPVVVGHPSHDDPAFGWASGFEVDDRGILVAELDNLAPAFVSAVAEGRYRKVSMKFFAPDAPNNPKPGTYYPRHVGFLGGAAPAVAGLAPVEFAGDDTGTLEIELAAPDLAFADYGLKDTAKLFRSLREWIIDKFGLEDADKAIDSWFIQWIDEAGNDDMSDASEFAAPAPVPATPTRAPAPPEPAPIAFTSSIQPENTMSDPDLAAREARLAERERQLANAENAAFADALVAEGHVAAGSRDRLVGLLAAIPADAAEVSFADGDAAVDASPRDLLRDLLAARPAELPNGQVVTDDGTPAPRGPAFAAPDGFEVDPDQMDLHAQASAYQAANPGVSFADAAIAVQNGAS